MNYVHDSKEEMIKTQLASYCCFKLDSDTWWKLEKFVSRPKKFQKAKMFPSEVIHTALAFLV